MALASRPAADPPALCAFELPDGCEQLATTAVNSSGSTGDFIRRSLPARDRGPADTSRHRGIARAPRTAATCPRSCLRSAGVPCHQRGGGPNRRRASSRQEISPCDEEIGWLRSRTPARQNDPASVLESRDSDDRRARARYHEPQSPESS